MSGIPIVRLGELLAPSKTTRASNRRLPILSMTMHGGLVDQADKFKKRIASRETDAYLVVKRHQLVVGFPIDEGVLSFQEQYEEAIVSPAYAIWDVRQPDAVDRAYLERFLRSPHALGFYEAKLRSTTARRRSLPRDTFLSMPIPLPPIPEQRRIAAILDKADAVRRKRQETLDLADQFLRSAFLDMFGDPVTNPKGWPTRRLKDLCVRITDIDHKMPASVDAGYPLISAKDLLGDGAISFDGAKHISEEDFRRLSRKSKPQNGDILYSRIGTVGKAGLVEVDFDFLASYSCCTITPNHGLVEPRYLCYLLDSPFVLRQAQVGVRAIAVPDLGLGTIKAFRIISPPLELQRRFATIVESVEEQRSKRRAHLAALGTLSASTQQRAFRGEL